MSTTDPLTLRLRSWLCESFDLARVKPRRDHSQPQSPNTPTDGKLDDLESFSRSLQRDGARRKASGHPKDPGRDL